MADAFNERLSKVGITRVQWIALFYLGKKEGISQKEFGELMEIKDSTVARLIDRMENEGYLYRKKDSKDRRITNVYLTEKGKTYREELLPEGEEMAEIFSEGLSKEEIEVFMTVLNKIMSNIGEEI